jgi:hypothetical protein
MTSGQPCRAIGREVMRSVLELIKPLLAAGQSCDEVLEVVMPASLLRAYTPSNANLPSRVLTLLLDFLLQIVTFSIASLLAVQLNSMRVRGCIGGRRQPRAGGEFSANHERTSCQAPRDDSSGD